MNREEGLSKCAHSVYERVFSILLFYFKYNTELESACYNFYLLVFTSCFYGTLCYCIRACSGTQAVKFNAYLVGDGIITYYTYYWAVLFETKYIEIMHLTLLRLQTCKTNNVKS